MYVHTYRNINILIIHVYVFVLYINTEDGHPQFKSATLQYCGPPNLLRSCGLKKAAELQLWTFKI
jgi:hypothetical protein